MTLLGFTIYRLLTASALASALNTGLAPSEGFCREGWTYAEKTHDCYRVIFAPKTWEGALESCKAWNATLPIIHDKDTDEALHDYAAYLLEYSDAEYFHIGLRRSASSGEWQWTDGSKMDYARWKEHSEASPACAYAKFSVRSRTSLWRPVECNSWQRAHICVARVSGSFPTTYG
ncbi:C-type lectin-1, partial [Aphelenchoides avenae]